LLTLSVLSVLGLADTDPLVLGEYRSDVYSYGVILWELVTQKIPWDNLNTMQVNCLSALVRHARTYIILLFGALAHMCTDFYFILVPLLIQSIM
jgi:serine/threonine protein kinase